MAGVVMLLFFHGQVSGLEAFSLMLISVGVSSFLP
jgi:hypothetical protein